MTTKQLARTLRWMACMAILAIHLNVFAQVQGNIVPGQVLFWNMARQPAIGSAFGNKASFNNAEAVYANAVPLGGMKSVEGQTAYLVTVAIDGQPRAEVNIMLNGPQWHEKAIPFPVLPRGFNNTTPELSKTILTALKGQSGNHEVSLGLYLQHNRTFLAKGTFTIDAFVARGHF